MGHAAALVEERRALLRRTESLVREFHPALAAGAVIRTVVRCRAELLHSGMRRGLARATEARVRAQLAREEPRLSAPEVSPRAGATPASRAVARPGRPRAARIAGPAARRCSRSAGRRGSAGR